MGRDGVPDLTKEQVLARLTVAGLDNAEAIAPFLRQSVWLRADPSSTPRLLGSRFGGPAMVPPEFEWPYYDAEPYLGSGAGDDGTFTVFYGEKSAAPLYMIAQINLAEIPLHTALPSAGLLTFFIDPYDGVWGHERSDRSGFRVTFTPADRMAGLVPREMPGGKAGGAFAGEPWPHLAASFFLKWGLGERERLSKWIDDLHDREPWSDVPDKIREAWEEMTGYGFGHFLMDAGLNHQGDPRESAVLLLDSPEEPDDGSHEAYLEHQAEIGRRASEWTTLFSITKDDRVRPNVSDTGGLSFVLRKDDLSALRFDRAWIVRS